MSVLDRLYARLPVHLQHVAVTLFGAYWHALRFGPGYKTYVQDYLAREKFTKAQWEEWQSEHLKVLLAACVHHVAYYRDNWTGIQRKAALAGELNFLPRLEKDPIRVNPRYAGP
jgi:phenylacetate-CoA ligase